MNEINIDDILDEIEFEEKIEEKKEVVAAPSKKLKIEENLPDASADDELMQTVVNMVMEDRKKADDLYNVFVPDVSTGRDRSEGSKEAMTKAVELKISAAKNIIELLKLKKNEKSSVGLYFGEVMNGRKAGINIASLTEE